MVLGACFAESVSRRPRTGKSHPRLAAPTSRQPADDVAILAFGECPESFGGHIAQCPDRQGELRNSFVIGKLRDYHSVVLSHGQVPGVNFSSRLFGGSLRGFESCWTFFNLCDCRVYRIRFTKCGMASALLLGSQT